MADNSKFKYFNNCVNWDPRDVEVEGGLADLIENSNTVDRNIFLRHVSYHDLAMLEKELGYTKDFKMENDWHVTYFKSKHHEEIVYGFVHSAIEYIFERDIII